MNDLNYDCQLQIFSFLQPRDIKSFHHTCKQNQDIINELSKYTCFTIHCNVIISDKDVKWCQKRNIKLIFFEEYRTDGFGTKRWYKNGRIHRDNDLVAVICKTGKQIWYQNGQIHRDNDLPAVIYANGSKLWYQNGQAHRNGLNNPAYISNNPGYISERFYHHGIELSRSDFNKLQMKKNQI